MTEGYKKPFLVFSAIVLVGFLVSASVWWKAREGETSAQANRDSTEEGISPSGFADANPVGKTREPISPLTKRLCSSGLKCEHEPLLASSIEEARWLQKFGYPSQEEVSQFSALSESQLERQAASGSLAALAVYGGRLTKSNRLGDGLLALKQAADNGSIYAYYELSNAYATNSTLKNNIDAAAFLRVAYLLGDSKAATAIQMNFPGLGPVDNRAIDMRAASLYSTFANERPASPRPL